MAAIRANPSLRTSWVAIWVSRSFSIAGAGAEDWSPASGRPCIVVAAALVLRLASGFIKSRASSRRAAETEEVAGLSRLQLRMPPRESRSCTMLPGEQKLYSRWAQCALRDIVK